MLVAVERNGPVRAALVDSDKVTDLMPEITQFVDRHSHLMTDQLQAYQIIDRLHSLLSRAPGRQLRRTINGGIQTADLNPISV